MANFKVLGRRAKTDAIDRLAAAEDDVLGEFSSEEIDQAKSLDLCDYFAQGFGERAKCARICGCAEVDDDEGL
jgi:hypothetical protein